MNSPLTTRVSIVDDDDKTRNALVGLIRAETTLQLVSDHGITTSALEGLPRERPDVVLMDINMPGANGVECVRQLKPRMPNTQFLMLTVYEDTEHIFAALAAGATGYLLKSTRREELVAAINQIMTGGSPMSSNIARKVVQSFGRSSAKSAELATLSPREASVLTLLTKGYQYKEIADALNLSMPTIDTYIRRIYEKLQVHSRSEAIAKFLSP